MQQSARGGKRGGDKTALRFVEGSIGDPDRLRAIGSGDRLNAIGSEFLRNVGVDEGIRTKIGELEIGIEHVDPAVLSVIGSVQKSLPIVRGYGQARVGGADG